MRPLLDLQLEHGESDEDESGRSKDLVDNLIDAKYLITDHLSDLDYPIKEKTKVADGPMLPFIMLQQEVHARETLFRDAATKMKKDGKEQIAENAAKVYEKILKIMRGFNEDPTKEVQTE